MTNTLQEDAERLLNKLFGNDRRNQQVLDFIQAAFNAGAEAMRNSAIAIAQNNKDNNRRDNHIAFEIRNLPRPEYGVKP